MQAQYLRTSVCVFGASMQTQHSLSSADATAAAGRGAEEAVLAFFVHLSAAVGAATARLAGVAVGVLLALDAARLCCSIALMSLSASARDPKFPRGSHVFSGVP